MGRCRKCSIFSMKDWKQIRYVNGRCSDAEMRDAVQYFPQMEMAAINMRWVN